MRTVRFSRLGSPRAAARLFAHASLCPIVWSATLVVCVACTTPPVEWSAERSVSAPPRHAMLTADGALVPDTMADLAARVGLPGDRCPGSLAIARAGTRLFAVWWSARTDSSARLLAARSDDGGTRWSAPSAVDTTDTGVTGCQRSAPSIAADSVSGYVHVAYALRGREGPGLFFSHSMDAGVTFHEPVPIVYGERLGRTSVASDGDHVAIAFEDPNSDMPRVGLALSRTMGHIFEERILPVSSDGGRAWRPLVAVRGKRIAVAWERQESSAATAPVFAVKAGTLH